MSKSRYRPEHMRMLNDKRWRDTKRIVWERAQGLCEWCKRDGYIVPGVDCHHIIPFESAKTQAEMERLCYDATGNVVLLCVPCHVKAPVELRSQTKEKVKARRSESFERWKDAIKRGQSDAGISSAEHEHPRMECKSRLKGDQKLDDPTTDTPGI